MVLPKSTVHVSRLAGTALKSFTHGYAQTVVAASQSSYASQNTPVAPLAGNFLSRFKDKSGKGHSQHAHFSTSSAQHLADATAAKYDQQDTSLAHFHDAWLKHNKSDSKDRHASKLAKRVEWKPSVAAQEVSEDVASTHTIESVADGPAALKRSYSMSAVDNFTKAIDNEAAEAIAIAQVNESLSEEVQRTRKDYTSASDVTSTPEQATEVSNHSNDASSMHSARITDLLATHQFAQIPGAFESMLRDGVPQPSQQAYQALLASALHLTGNKHQKAPRVLDIYSDMLHRRVSPSAETLTIIVDALATRALDAAQTSQSLANKHARLGSGSSSFPLEQLELKVMAEDQTLNIALRFIETATCDVALSGPAYEALITACAVRGQAPDMIKLYNTMRQAGHAGSSAIFPAMITAFGKVGDLRNAVAVYDDYRDMAISNNVGESSVVRIDQEVYAALINAYGQAGSLDKGKKLLARIDFDEKTSNAPIRSRDAILADGLLPLELSAGNFDGVYSIVNHLSTQSYPKALNKIVQISADRGDFTESVKAFDALVDIKADLLHAAESIFALHVRTGKVESGERFYQVLEGGSITLESMQLSVLRAVHFIATGDAERGLFSARIMIGRFRASITSETVDRQSAVERVEEAIEALCRAIFKGTAFPISTAASAEVLRIMNDNGMLLASYSDAMLSSLSANEIHSMPATDLNTFVQAQARAILDDQSHDAAGPARFGCMLESIASRSALPDVSTETLIEKALVCLDRGDLSRLWNGYRYPLPAAFTSAPTPASSVNAPSSLSAVVQPPTFEDSFDPYLANTDHKGSVLITDILERSNGKPSAMLSDALAKLRNIRRAGRHPRFFAYAKLIQGAAKAGQLDRAREMLDMAKQDVPYLAQYRIVRHGWISILDSMVAACITVGRRDLAARYHQDLLNMGAAPSANTFGLYITSLKETTKTFDEASEAVKIFLRSKAEGVEPTSFLYNALIGKLGKARRIDDCLFYFAEMRGLGIKPTSVTYGTIVNALCRVSDEKFAEEIFEEMESCANYKPRPAPYHSLMQFFLTTKRDRSKVVSYYERMRKQGIEPTVHTFKLLIDAHATIEPVQMTAAEAVLGQMQHFGIQPEAVHYASLIHAKGCVEHDMAGARASFDQVAADSRVKMQACVYQALLESMVANHMVKDAEGVVADMQRRGIEVTPYIVNALIHGWTLEKDLSKAQAAFNMVDLHHREPSTYEAMVRAHIAVEDREGAAAVISEALSRGYPHAVAGKIAELLSGPRV